ncbi:MAG TPA: hypothetical protein VMZ03_03885 [Chitinophagaceae bacterium]|nr:hypothetical protein [Chitinophagaceae bacterium]
MSEELISEYIDRGAIEGDTKFLTDQLKTVLDLFDKVNATKITLQGAKSMKDITEGAREAAKATDELAKGKEKLIQVDLASIRTLKEQVSGNKQLSDSYQDLIKVQVQNEIVGKALREERSKLNKAFKDGQISAEQLAAGLEEIKQVELTLKGSNQELSRALRNMEKDAQAAEGSLDKLRAQLNLSLQAFDKLSEKEKASNVGVELKTKINSLTDTISEQEQATQRFQRNVGNYANSFSKASESITGGLTKIQQQIKSGDFSGQQLQALQRQEAILINITDKLGQQFNSTKQQSRAFQEAVAQIGVEFGHTSEIFQQFKNQVGEGVDTLNDIRDSIKLASSDTRQLDRFIGAATAIAGGFSLAQGAVGLFGKENEDLQKTLVKVQSVMLILNGLQAIQNELKNKDSILRKLTNFLVKEETKSIQSQAAAQAGNATATDNAAKATNRFGVALKSIGIGLLLSLIPLVASAMDKLGKSANKVDKDLKDMGNTADEIADTAIKNLDEEINSLNDSFGRTPSNIDKAKKALQLLQAEGKKISLFGVDPENFSENFFRLDVLNVAKERGQDLLSILGLMESRISENQKKQAEIRNKISEVEFLNRLKQAQDFLDAEFEFNRNAIKNSADLDKDLHERQLASLKKQFDERKILEGEFLRKGKGQLQAILNDELKVIQANLDTQLASAADNISKRKEAEDNAHTQRVLAERNFQDKLTALLEEAEKRRRKITASTVQGIVEITGSELSKMAQALDKITGNSIPDRLEALGEAFKEAKNKIIDQLKEVRKELAFGLLSAFEGIASGTFDKEKNRIQEQIDLLDKKKEKEIVAVNASVQSTQDKAAAVALIEAKAQVEKEQLEKRQRQIDEQKAKFEKATAILHIGIDTIQKVAAIKAQAALLLANPLTAVLAPLALAQIPFVLITGAIAAAAVAAKPIPKFRKGRDKGPETLAITGDGGVPEVVTSPDMKEAYMTPAKDTLTYLKKDWKVFPDADAYIEAAFNMSMKPLPAIQQQSYNEEKLAGYILAGLRKHSNEVVGAINSKPEHHTYLDNGEVKKMVKKGNDHWSYIQDKTQ